MAKKPTYEELERKVKELKKIADKCKRAEVALKESEDKYRSLVESTQDSVYMVDRNCRYLFMNKKYLSRFDSPKDNYLGRTYGEFHSEEATENFKERINGVIETGKSQSYEYKSDRDGRYFIRTLSPVKVSTRRETVVTVISKDITERKLTEETLRKSEEKYRELSDLLPQVVFETDERGNITFANRIAFNLFGYTRDDFIKGVNAFQMLIPEDRDRAKENIERILKGEKETGTEYTALRKDGKIFPALIHSSPIVSEGVSIGIRGAITDLSEIKRAEEALRESEKKMRNIIEHSSEIFYIHDIENNLTYVSSTSKEILGYTSDEMMRDWTELTTGNPINKKGIEITERAIETGEKQNPYLLEVKRKNNTPVLLEIDESPIKDEEGKVVGITGAARDVTEHKKAEEALRKSEEKFRFLAENMADIIWIIDRDFQTTYVSPSIENVLGFTPEERKRQSLEEMITPESLQKVQAMFIKELQRDAEVTVDLDRSVIIEVEYYHKDGSTVWVENIVKAIRDPVGAIIGMHGVSRDINDRKQAEEALRKSEIKHKTLVHNIPGMVYRAYTDWSAEIISGSKEVCGYTNEELNSQEENWLSIIHPDDKKKVFKEALELTKRQQDAVQIYRIATKDGNIRWVEDRKTSIFSGEGEFKGIDGIVFDITARKQTEETLKEKELELVRKNLRLEELNSALKILLEKRDQDKTELEENVLTNMKELVLPYAEKLKKAGLSNKQEVFADILQSNLENIVSPFARKLKSKYLGFTPTELKVANLVKQGLSTKEIADLLNSSSETISGHRKRMRKKLKLTDKKSNLRTHLLSLNNV